MDISSIISLLCNPEQRKKIATIWSMAKNNPQMLQSLAGQVVQKFKDVLGDTKVSLRVENGKEALLVLICVDAPSDMIKFGVQQLKQCVLECELSGIIGKNVRIAIETSDKKRYYIDAKQ